MILAVAVLMTVLGANAQSFNKGDWFVSAQSTSLDFNTNFGGGSSASNLDLSAAGGYFFTDKFTVDAMAGIDYAKIKGADGVNAFNFGAGIRYYPLGNLFARIGYNGQARTDVDLISYIDAKVGYDLFLSDRIFFEPAVYYEKNITKGAKQNILGLSVGFGFSF